MSGIELSNTNVIEEERTIQIIRKTITGNITLSKPTFTYFKFESDVIILVSCEFINDQDEVIDFPFEIQTKDEYVILRAAEEFKGKIKLIVDIIEEL
jgi:hypothetical protein